MKEEQVDPIPFIVNSQPALFSNALLTLLPWSPTPEQDDLIRSYQAFRARFGRRPTRAAAVSAIMRMGLISCEHERINRFNQRIVS
jgi:hypothetical protein